MIGLDTIVLIVLALIVATVIFALLYGLIEYIGREFPVVVPYLKVARVILVIGGTFVLIGILLHLIGFNIIRIK